MRRQKLSPSAIEKLLRKHAGRDAEIPDHGCPGLRLRIRKSGAASWAFVYRRDGRAQRMTLGRYPSVSLDAARGLCGRWAAVLAEDKDPITVRDQEARKAKLEAEGARTVARLVEEYLTIDVEGRELRMATDYRKLMDRDVLPVLGSQLADEVTQRDAARLIEHKWKVERHPGSARQLFAVCQRMFNWAKATGRASHNPFAGVERPPDVARDEYLSATQVREFFDAMDRLNLLPAYRAGLTWTFMHGCRRGEIVGAQWQDFDRAERRWTIPKTRRKTKSTHEMYLTDAALGLLDSIPRNIRSKYVFPSPHTPDKHRDVDRFTKATKAVFREAGFDFHGVAVHLFRHTVGHHLDSLGFGEDDIAAVLGHARHSVTSRYTHSDTLRRSRPVLEAWHEHLLGEILGADRPWMVAGLE